MSTAGSDVSPLAELLGHAFYHFDRIKPLLPTYGHLLVSSLFPIWIGAHASLSRPSSAAKPNKENTDIDDEGEDAENEQGPVQKMEGLEPSDALVFPITAGLTLGGLYLVIKWLEDPAILNKILSFYFSQMGVFFAIAFLKDAFLIVRSLSFPRSYRSGGKLWRASQSERVFKAWASDGSKELGQARHSPLPGISGAIPLGFLSSPLWTCRNALYQRVRLRAQIRGLFNVKPLVGLLDLFSVVFALGAVGYFAFVDRPWWLTNFLGFSFCYGALQFMSPSTFWTGTLILGSLFFYDIYFVFFTPLMVTVATKLDVPIKLLFPRPPTPSEAPDAQSLAMLGLGDIVIPGMVIGLALRFDLFLYYQRKNIQKARVEGSGEEIVKVEYQSATGGWGERFWAPAVASRELELKPPYYNARSFPKTYFKASVVGYVFGMVTTLLAMQYSNHPQPALLYLVPGVLISLWGTAFFRGQTKIMWDFSDAEEEEAEEKDEESKNKAEEGDKEQKSLFMRLWSGELKVSSLYAGSPKKKKSADQKPESKEIDKDQKSTETNSNKEKEADEDAIVLFSVSFPPKPKVNNGSSSAGKDGMVTIPENVEGDNEPPLKKRRGSPKKPSPS
ncbi:hypothetical protein N7492_003233 [Penicillium capsulatum]|uniref:Signal peptide peptidase n=1 Tax=Penicillium capsulatum TaxID=69766 RepID=A0A9W9LW07_9EURO|nr:hypothetical protein N7492_003233 [Penicillium capsulatum]KAJ6122180.1 hypothetical protein N7512_004645 [Penicillium capsulatum]